jgi:hypothetical protein
MINRPDLAGIADAGGAIVFQSKDGHWKGGFVFTVGKWTGIAGNVYGGGPWVEYNF